VEAVAGPAITSNSSATFAVGVNGDFTVTTTDFTTIPMISESGALPTGVTFVDNGDGTATLEGTPAAGQAGTYPLIISATDASSQSAMQNFTLTVAPAQRFTSNSAATFTATMTNSFAVTTTGFTSAPTISESGSLPGGVTYTENAGGTLTLFGTPASGAGGAYDLVFTATGDGTTITQDFTLSVVQVPTFTSAASSSFFTGSNDTFTISTTAFPTAALAETGTLPGGISFTDNGNGTATLSGDATVAGTFVLTLSATNSVGAATQTFTLTSITQAPIFALSGQTLTLTGTSETDNVVMSVSNGQVVVTYDSLTQDYQVGSIHLIDLNMGSGATTVDIGAGVPSVISSGGSGTDTVTANNSARDTLTGGSGGADSINASGSGADSLAGSSAGNDTLVAGSGDCTLQAVAGNNSLVGGSSADLLEGGSGADTMVAGGGNNSLMAGSGADSMVGGGGQDFMQGGAGNDTMIAGDGNSTLFSGAGSDSLVGGAGADEMKAVGPGNTTVVAGSGDQTLKAVNGNDSLLGGSGLDRLRGGGGRDTLVAGSGTTTIKSSLGQDSIVANAGNDDLVKAFSGRDTVIGAIGPTGMDTIYSVLGDSIDAGPRDVLIGPT